MSKRVRLKNLVKILKDSNLEVEGIDSVEIWFRNGKSVVGMRLRLDDPDVDAMVELSGDFSSNQLPVKLVRLGVVKG